MQPKIKTRLLFSFIFLGIFFITSKSSAAWSHVQTNAATTTASTSVLAFSSNNATSNLIIAEFDWDATYNFTSISDSQGNNYVQIGAEQNISAIGAKTRLYYAKNIKAGANTVTAKISGTPVFATDLYIHEYSGLDTLNPLDAYSVNNFNTGATTFTSNNATTTAANDLLYGAIVAGNQPNATSGWTTRANLLDGSIVADSNATTTGSYAFTGTIPGVSAYGAWIAAFAIKQPPSTPSSLGPTNKVDGSWSTSTQPLLSFTQSDPNASDTVQYRIQISTSSSFASQTVDYTSALLSQGSTSFTVGQAAGSGLYTVGTSSQTLSDGSYYWRVMSTDNSGATSSYATANGGGIAFGIDTVSPTGTIASSTFGTITSSTIVINRPSTSTITESGSGLYQWQARRNSATALSAVSTSTATTSDSSLTSNTQYTYDVRFIDLVGNISSYGATSSKYTLTPTPTNLSASPSQTSNILSVDSFNNASSGSSGYYFLNTTNSNNSGWITINSWTDTGLTCNTSYTYTIKYRNGDGTESATSSVSQTTSACTVSSAISGAGLPISILSPSVSININQYPSVSSSISQSPSVSNNINQYLVSFSKPLFLGLQNQDVKNLQFLLSHYSDVYPEAKITGYYGPLTKQAVQKLQLKYNITNQSNKAFGYVGPSTRRILNLLEQINYLQKQINLLLNQLKRS